MKNTPMPPRTKPMARTAIARTAPTVRTVAATRRANRDTGFTYEQRLAVRTRAGNGDVEDARCEACNRWLGRYGGQVHHRCNRGSGGSRLRNRLSNAALVCGTPQSGCHGACTGLSTVLTERMRAEGFVLDSGQDPLAESIMLHGERGGFQVWLTDDGSYREDPPEVSL